MADPQTITQLLHDWRGGREEALDQLLPHLYDELRRIAHGLRRHERADLTLNTTALVHEAYLKLVGPQEVDWQDRAHFLSVAARAMRQVLVSYARRRTAAKRGGGARALALEDALDEAVAPWMDGRVEEVMALETALVALEQLDPRYARVVECRYFAGMTVAETAAALSVSEPTVYRDWRFARAWLAARLGDEAGAALTNPPYDDRPRDAGAV